MNPLQKLNRLYRPAKLTQWRMVLALAVALTADGLQMIFNVFGWLGADQVIDCITMGLTIWILGFHILLLPTFIAELVPVIEELPTWTACVIAIIILRRREEHRLPPKEEPPIDV